MLLFAGFVRAVLASTDRTDRLPLSWLWPGSFKHMLSKEPLPLESDMEELKLWKPSDAGKHGSLQFDMKLSSFERVGGVARKAQEARSVNSRSEGTLVVQLVSMHDLPVRAPPPHTGSASHSDGRVANRNG